MKNRNRAFSNKSLLKSLPAIKTGILVIISLILICLWLLACFPLLNRDIFNFSSYGNDKIQTLGLKKAGIDKKDSSGPGSREAVSFDFLLEKPYVPQIPDYLIVTMTAKNTGEAAWPQGSFAVALGSYKIGQQSQAGNDDNLSYAIYERVKFYADGLKHTYYVPLGENRFYRYEFSPGKDTLKKYIDSLTVEFPQVEGVFIDIEKIELKQRTFFALDSYINYFLKNNFSITDINRYMTPLYIFIILSVFIYIISRFMLFSRFKKRANKALTFSLIAIVIASVIYLMAAGSFYSVKSYWDSYKKYIIEQNLDEAYYGFYDFEKFIGWLDSHIPAGENLSVLVRGEPVYIMAEMAYNLYPRDIKFVDISKKSDDEVISELQNINSSSNGHSSYRYVAILSADDKIESTSIHFILSYGKNGGFLYMLK